jgi:hypothetical protein
MMMAYSIRASGYGRVVLLSAVTTLALAGPAAAQELVVNQTGSTSINSNNAGDVSLRGDVSNATVSGINNSAGTMTALGASSAYSINETNLTAAGDEARRYTARVSDVTSIGSNSGSVNVRGTITGGTYNGNNLGQSISATGISNTIAIKTATK